MSTSAFNMIEWARQIGLKDISDARLNPNPAAVVSVGDMSALTPQYRPPTGLFGGTVASVAGQVSQVFVQSNDPGGVILKNVFIGFPSNLAFAMGTLDSALLPATATVFPLAGNFNQDPNAPGPSSRVFRNNQVAPLISSINNPPVNLLVGRDTTQSPPLVLAPGRMLIIETTAFNVSILFGVLLQAVPVSGTV